MRTVALAYLALADCVARSPITHFTLALLLVGPFCGLVALEMIGASRTGFELVGSVALSTLLFTSAFTLTYTIAKLLGAGLDAFDFD